MECNCKYNISGFAEELGCSVKDIADLFSEFVKGLDNEIDNLKAAVAERDWDKVKQIIHDIKGVSGNYRITDVYNKASEINNILKMSQYSEIQEVIEYFYILMESALMEIRSYFYKKGIFL